MFLKKGICLFLFATAALTLPLTLSHFRQENLDKVQADGGAPPVGPPKKLLRTGLRPNIDRDAPTPAANTLAHV